MTVRLAVALVAAAATAMASPAQQAAPRPADGARIEAVRLVGVRALDPRVVRAAIVTRASRCRSVLLAPVCALSDAGWAIEPAFLRQAELERDERRIREVYAAWGYPDADAAGEALMRRDGTAEVRFEIVEGEPVIVRSVEIRGVDAASEAVTLPPLPVRAGEPYAPVRLEATERLVGGALAEAGHALARVEFSEAAVAGENRVDVVITVRPGPVAVFGPTVVLPGPPLRVEDVERRLAYRPGERYRPSALDHTVERLYRVPVVERVFVDPLPAADLDSVVVTTIGVTPGRTRGLQLGGAFSTSRCLEGTLGWGHRYLFGTPRVLQLSGGASNLLARPLRSFPCTAVGEAEFEELDYLLRTELREPIGADSWLLLSGVFSRESAPQAFIRRGVQARIGLSRRLTRNLDATVAYAPERRDQLAAGPLFCGLHGVCTAEAIAGLAGDAVLAPLELSVGWTPPLLLRPPAPPPPGPAWMHPPLPAWLFSARITGATAGPPLGSAFTFGSTTAVATAVAGRGRRAELAARVRAGAMFAGDAVPPHLRVFGGGPAGVRGVAANRLGPRILSVTPDRVPELGCEPVTGGCDGVAVDPRLVRERPLGGGRLLETSLEARWWITDELQLAGFVDWGTVHSRPEPGAPATVARAESVWTPGLGVLVLSPFGPVRGDVGFDTSPVRHYALLMRDEADAQLHLGDVVYDRFGFGDPPPLSAVWRRLQFQLQMGLPF